MGSTMVTHYQAVHEPPEVVGVCTIAHPLSLPQSLRRRWERFGSIPSYNEMCAIISRQMEGGDDPDTRPHHHRAARDGPDRPPRGCGDLDLPHLVALARPRGPIGRVATLGRPAARPVGAHPGRRRPADLAVRRRAAGDASRRMAAAPRSTWSTSRAPTTPSTGTSSTRSTPRCSGSPTWPGAHAVPYRPNIAGGRARAVRPACPLGPVRSGSAYRCAARKTAPRRSMPSEISAGLTPL